MNTPQKTRHEQSEVIVKALRDDDQLRQVVAMTLGIDERALTGDVSLTVMDKDQMEALEAKHRVGGYNVGYDVGYQDATKQEFSKE